MKRWTRKLLAGLLSFGMLLQVASPLSALAADGGSAAPGLTVTVNDKAYTLAIDSSGQVIVPNEWTTAGLPDVSYADGTYTFDGRLGNLWAGPKTHDNISITGSDTAKPNVVLNEGSKYHTVQGLLTVENVNNFTSTGDIYGAAVLNCDGDVNLADGVAVGSLTVQSANNVTVAANNGSHTVSGDIKITCSGDVEITNSGNGTLTDSFIILNDITGSIKLSGGSGDASHASGTAGMLYLENCTGTLDITSNGAGRAVVSMSCRENTLLRSVTITSNGTAAAVGYEKYYSVDIVSSGEVKITNTNGPVAGGNLTVKANTVTLNGNSANSLITDKFSADISAASLTAANSGMGAVGQVKFTGTDTTSAYRVAVGESESNNTQTALTGTTYSETVNEKYLNIQSGTPENTTPDNAELKITAGGNDYRIDPKDISEYGKEYTIGYDTFLIYYHSEYDEFDIYGTVPDGTQIEGIGKHRPALQMTASTAGGIARPLTYGSLTIKNMGDVDLNGVIHENLTVENVKDVSSGVVGYAGSGNLIIDGAENVKYLTHVFGTIDIKCTGEVNIYGSRNGSVSDGANITAKSLMMKSVSINGSVGNVGHVKFTRTDTAGNYRILTGENEDTITSQTAMNGETFDQTVEETYLCIEPGTPHQHTLGEWQHDGTYHWHTCTNCDMQLDKAAHKFDENGVCECGYKDPNYKPEHQHTASTEWKYDDTNHWHTCTNCDVQMDKAPHDFGEDGKAEKCEECGFANPDYVAPDPDDTGTVDSGSDAGGAVAAVLMGGAAVWGGYEIATRVILHNILPEGTAIPANRGQLALLVWNNAGRPEPVNEPVFVDLDDAEMAKAAQWCVEQGIMEAKTAETFKPEGWTPKLKVIETWNKAFPKQ
mgnify:CR=1 FL=1